MSPHRFFCFARSIAFYRAGVGIAILLSFSCPAWAAGSCPENVFGISRTCISYWSTTPTGSIEWTESSGDQVVSWDAAQPCAEGCYDLPKGTVVARGSNYLYGPGDTHVGAADEYVVLGPAGPPLSFEVVLQLNATIEIEGAASAGLGVPNLPSEMIQLSATGFQELAMPITVAPGTPFQVSVSAHAVGGHFDGMGLAEAVLRFRGLPTGYVITSCQGYNLETPTRPASWGAVKARYR